MERLQAAETAADRYEAKYRAAKGNLQHTHASCTQQSSELEHLSEALFSEQELARSSQQAVEELSSRLSTVQVTHTCMHCSDMLTWPTVMNFISMLIIAGHFVGKECHKR